MAFDEHLSLVYFHQLLLGLLYLAAVHLEMCTHLLFKQDNGRKDEREYNIAYERISAHAEGANAQHDA